MDISDKRQMELNIISEKIKSEIAKNPPSAHSFGLALIMSKALTPEDFDTLEELEYLVGVEQANSWLCDVCVSSGKYRRDGDCVVPL